MTHQDYNRESIETPPEIQLILRRRLQPNASFRLGGFAGWILYLSTLQERAQHLPTSAKEARTMEVSPVVSGFRGRLERAAHFEIWSCVYFKHKMKRKGREKSTEQANLWGGLSLVGVCCALARRHCVAYFPPNKRGSTDGFLGYRSALVVLIPNKLKKLRKCWGAGAEEAWVEVW